MTTLVMGNINYSSWSVRPWFFLTHAEIPFEARVLPMDTPTFAADVASWSPSKRVPVLVLDDGTKVWDSLAIGETIAEEWPEAGVWPESAKLRRLARSACAEMHSSFTEMRRTMPCNARTRYAPTRWREIAGSPEAEAAVQADVDRVHALWQTLLQASGGPFLGGARAGYVDAFFAPVVSRFISYVVASPSDAAAWRERLTKLPTWEKWMNAAASEQHVIQKYEFHG
jgi:glutathione S-transferase